MDIGKWVLKPGRLAFILGLTRPNNQVSLTTKKCSAQGMVPPNKGDDDDCLIAVITIKSSLVPLIEGLGKAPSHIIVHQAVPVTRVK